MTLSRIFFLRFVITALEVTLQPLHFFKNQSRVGLEPGKKDRFEVPKVSDTEVRYVGHISIGANEQNFFVIFDTAATWSWVAGVECVGCRSSNAFNSTESRTYVSSSQDQVLDRHNCLGIPSADVFAVSSGEDTLATPDQKFLIYQNCMTWDFDLSDGVLVTLTKALPAPSGVKQGRSFVDNLKRQGKIERAVFALYLRDTSPSITYQTEAPSAISFGSWNLEKYAPSSELHWVSARSIGGYWALTLSSAEFGDVELVPNGKELVLIDTALDLIAIVPQTVMKQFTDSFCTYANCTEISDRVKFTCNSAEEVPELTLTFWETAVVFPREMLTSKEIGGCYTRVQTGNEWVLGNVLMRAYYTVFDMEQLKIGLARSVTSWSFFDPMPLIPFIIGLVICAIGIIMIIRCGRDRDVRPCDEDLPSTGKAVMAFGGCILIVTMMIYAVFAPSE